MSTDPETNLRLAAIEQQVARISQHLGIDCPPMPGALAAGFAGQATPAGQNGIPADVIELKRSGNLIGAIKRLREISGVDLATAKDIVERI